MSIESPVEAADQGQFLRDAMKRLGMTRKEFAERFGVAPKGLDNWLLTPGVKGYRSMPRMARKYIVDVLAWEAR